MSSLFSVDIVTDERFRICPLVTESSFTGVVCFLLKCTFCLQMLFQDKNLQNLENKLCVVWSLVENHGCANIAGMRTMRWQPGTGITLMAIGCGWRSLTAARARLAGVSGAASVADSAEASEDEGVAAVLPPDGPTIAVLSRVSRTRPRFLPAMQISWKPNALFHCQEMQF